MKIKKYIPDAITSMNLLCGAIGVVAVSQGKIELAFLFMIGGAVFDFFDGFSARMLGAYSPMGKELDSLADDITFGLLPAYMMYSVGSKAGMGLWAFAALLIAVFSGLRLAKFNIDERQTTSFLGVPTPACAMICGSLSCYMAYYGSSSALASLLAANGWAFAALCVILSLLLVSEIPMFSMKMHKGEGMSADMVRRIIFAAASLAALIYTFAAGRHWTLAVLIAFTSYIIINLIRWPKTRQ